MVTMGPVGRVVLDHPVGCSLSEAFGIFVDDGFFVVVGFCIVHQSLLVTFNLGEIGILAPLQFALEVVSAALVGVLLCRAYLDGVNGEW